MKRKGAFDHILLETTGLADPGTHTNVIQFTCTSRNAASIGPIASMFWQNEEFSQGLGREIHLDGVVCVVDAVFGRQVRPYMPQNIVRKLTLRGLEPANGRRPCRRWRRGEPTVGSSPNLILEFEH